MTIAAINASCATSSHPPETRTEPARVVDPTAGTFTYKGRTIVFDEAVEPPLMMIDGKSIKVFRSTAGETKFLELTAELSGDRSLAREARPLAREERRRKRASQFFKLRSATERRLAELKTPAVARQWGFRMNMSGDSFASMFRKAARVTA